jgi:hypothetical protein
VARSLGGHSARIAVALPHVILRRRPMPALFPEGGRYGLPADFLVSPVG